LWNLGRDINQIENSQGSDDFHSGRQWWAKFGDHTLTSLNWGAQSVSVVFFELESGTGILTLLDRRYVPTAVIVDYESLALPVVVAVAKEGKSDAEFLPERVFQTFAEFLPGPFALDKFVVVIVECDEYFRDVGAELIELRFTY
jgi:hypothetical protein